MQTARERSRSGGIKCRARIGPYCLQELLSCQPLKRGGYPMQQCEQFVQQWYLSVQQW